MIYSYAVIGKKNFRNKVNAITAIINIMTWLGFILNLLLYSSLYLIKPPPEEGMLIP